MTELFEWDEEKNSQNILKHEIDFYEAKYAFKDKNRVIANDQAHSTKSEKRYFCIALLNDKIVTVRFTKRGKLIRIIGAGYWRKGRKIYEKQNNIHR